KSEEVGPSRFDFQIFKDDFGTETFAGLEWNYMTYLQNGMKVNGFRLGRFAYVLDIRHYTEAVIEALKGVEVLVLSALRYTTSPSHLSLDEAVAFAEKVGAKKTWFSHVAHELEYEEANQKLPSNIQVAYDGLEITFVYKH